MIDVEMRYKSKAGVDLTGKNVAVVYETAQEYPYSAFVESLADGFAWNLEADYQDYIDSLGVSDLMCRLRNMHRVILSSLFLLRQDLMSCFCSIR